MQLLELALHHFLVLVIGHAEPARVRAQNGHAELAAVDELADQARQQTLGFEFAVRQRAEEVLKVGVQLL